MSKLVRFASQKAIYFINETPEQPNLRVTELDHNKILYATNFGHTIMAHW